MAVIVNGDGILTGVSSLTTALDDITSGRGTVTGVATVGTLQLGAGVSISSPRTQQAAIFTNNTEFFTVDDAGRVGVGTITPNSDAHPENDKKINVGFITAKSIAGDIDARNVVVAGVSTFVGALNASSGAFTGDVSIADKIVHTGDTNTAIRFPSNDAFSVETAGSERFAIASNGNKNISNGHLTITSTYIDFAGSISTPGTAAAIYRPADNNLAFSTGNVERIRITGNSSANCKVGINTVNPTRVLSVYNSVTGAQDPAGNNSGGLIIHNAAGDATDNYGFGKYAALELAVGHGANSVGNIGLVRTGNNIGDIFFSGRTGGSSYKEHMRITSDGKIGIGLTNPDQILECSKSSGTTLIKAAVGGNSRVGFEIEKTGSTTQTWRIQDGQSGNGILEVYDQTDSRSVMTFGGTGNVTIGAGNLIMGTSGKGIDFSASSGGNSTSSLLEDYEEGTVNITMNSHTDKTNVSVNGNTTLTSTGYYVKFGNMVYVTAQFSGLNASGGNPRNDHVIFSFSGLPYATYSGTGASTQTTALGYNRGVYARYSSSRIDDDLSNFYYYMGSNSTIAYVHANQVNANGTLFWALNDNDSGQYISFTVLYRSN